MKVLDSWPQWRQSNLITLKDFKCCPATWRSHPGALRAGATSTELASSGYVQPESKSSTRRNARIETSRIQREASAATVLIHPLHQVWTCCADCSSAHTGSSGSLTDMHLPVQSGSSGFLAEAKLEALGFHATVTSAMRDAAIERPAEVQVSGNCAPLICGTAGGLIIGSCSKAKLEICLHQRANSRGSLTSGG